VLGQLAAEGAADGGSELLRHRPRLALDAHSTVADVFAAEFTRLTLARL